MARPKREFSTKEEQDIELYARNGSYNRTIATGLNIPIHTLERRFGTKIRHWRAKGKLKLRDELYKQAKNSPQTAIFIAKNELGMTDKQVIETKQTPLEQTDAQRKATEAAAQAYKLKLVRPSA